MGAFESYFLKNLPKILKGIARIDIPQAGTNRRHFITLLCISPSNSYAFFQRKLSEVRIILEPIINNNIVPQKYTPSYARFYARFNMLGLNLWYYFISSDQYDPFYLGGKD
ncbi:hypothetical protein SAMN04487895_12242 [Paenibacillus sophorae]|uniref:Uncharacterized protein n=1 Tax=Paenibacillus sophorae TaxID=1333845 RepID=A0A1H8V9Z6_9BACL|nr:hypothetical protein SAMN04487895_12242 [Paenibacillus sophorae]